MSKRDKAPGSEAACGEKLWKLSINQWGRRTYKWPSRENEIGISALEHLISTMPISVLVLDVYKRKYGKTDPESREDISCWNS